MQIYKSLDEVVEAGTIAPDSIINADCLEAMKLIPDKSIDCIICDLPYSITNCHWDKLIPFEPLWEQYKRIIKPNGAIALFGSQPFTSALVMSNPKWFKYAWIWEKENASNFFAAKFQPLNNTEDIIIFSDGGCNNGAKKPIVFNPQNVIKMDKNCINGKNVGGLLGIAHGTTMKANRRYKQTQSNYPFKLLKYKRDANKQHPTQKPVALIEYLIKTYTLENEIIVDNTAGSGTLAIAAINTNRRYICIEKDPGYFELMRDRIENHDPNALVTPKKTKSKSLIKE